METHPKEEAVRLGSGCVSADLRLCFRYRLAYDRLSVFPCGDSVNRHAKHDDKRKFQTSTDATEQNGFSNSIHRLLYNRPLTSSFKLAQEKEMNVTGVDILVIDPEPEYE